ncbi:MAG: fibrobacter succinogenes major paralogous domain-containing protein [Candidatus Marinimicrobia bacterium]|nr:fibrobacter succinogenes major paralogous domain-containing protein [Candidatus Neomarinimicrobiota bacterium]
MAENLKVTHYRNGDPISNVTDNSEWENLSPSVYCYYDNSDSLRQIYGALYNWYTCVDERNIAPEGWYVPTDEEWEELAQYISDQNGGYSKSRDDWDDVGTHLKSTSGWNSGGNGTDDYGFSGLPAGYRDTNGSYYSMGDRAHFWSATEYSSRDAWRRALDCYYANFYRGFNRKGRGFSVRCVRD